MAMQDHKVNWNDQADMYSAFAFCELDDTRTYLDAIGVTEGDSVLDVCCGPGRISVIAAERGAFVTGVDSAERMLAYARENAHAMGVDERCDFRLLDWNHVLPGQNLQPADVVIASRCGAIMDVEKLSALARRTVGVQIFANAPSIPALLGVLFSGCGEDRGPASDSQDRPGASAPVASGPTGPAPASSRPGGQRPDGPEAKESIYLKIADKAFKVGYEPNVRCFPERFRKTFESTDEALAWVAALKPARAQGNEERLALNVAPFLTEVDGGVEFCIATRAAIIWWNVA